MTEDEADRLIDRKAGASFDGFDKPPRPVNIGREIAELDLDLLSSTPSPSSSAANVLPPAADTLSMDQGESWEEIYRRGYPREISRLIRAMDIDLLLSCLVSRPHFRSGIPSADEMSLIGAAFQIKGHRLNWQRLSCLEERLEKLEHPKPIAIQDVGVGEFFSIEPKKFKQGG